MGSRGIGVRSITSGGSLASSPAEPGILTSGDGVAVGKSLSAGLAG
jgi:hypothetical protein